MPHSPGRGLLAGALVAMLLLLTGPAAAASSEDCTRLTVREQAQQVVVAGFAGTEATPAALQLVARDVGGIILMGHNVRDADQVRSLTADLRAHAPHRLLVAVDEEGGRVARLGSKGAAPTLPTARALGERRTPADVRALAADLGRHLRELGVDWNLAPVLDVTDAPAGTVIGDRAWASDPQQVADFGGAFARGMTDAGVLTAGKHFPGHGATDVDSHVALPTVDVATETLRSRDLVPFLHAVAELDAIMTAHVVIPELDPDRPASLSAATTRLLRDDLGFEGVIITDALEMGAVAEQWDVPAAAELAIAAGADVALITRPGEEASRAVDRITEAVEADRIPPARLAEAATRVLRAKGYSDAAIACLLDSTQAETSSVRLQAELAGGERSLVSIVLSRARYPAGSANRVFIASGSTAGETAQRAAGRADAPLLHLPDGASPTRQATVAAEVRRVLAPGGVIYVLDGVRDTDLGVIAADQRTRGLVARSH